jgi:hypothetical protein
VLISGHCCPLSDIEIDVRATDFSVGGNWKEKKESRKD